MNAFEQRKLIEVVLYILNKVGGIDFYHLFKILYFADREHLAKSGYRIIQDDFKALQYGPVPNGLYSAVKKSNRAPVELHDLFEENIDFADEDAPNVLIPKREADTDYISKSEIQSLDNSIKENANLSFNDLKTKSHDTAWNKANKSVNNIIDIMDMAISGNASDAVLESIQEEIELETALS